MNAVMAWILFSLAFMVGVPQPIAAPAEGEHAHIIIAEIIPGSPAAAAGLKPGDELLDITDASGDRVIGPLTPDAVVAFVRDHAGEALTVTYTEAEKTLQATLHPSQGVISHEAGQPALGVALTLVASRSESILQSLTDGFMQTLYAFKNVAMSLWGLLSTSIEGALNLSQVVGPVGIVSYVGAASQNGAGAVLMLAAIISVNLAIINLIPIPALDGGRLAILGVEAMTRREAPRIAVRILNALGIALIVVLMLLVTYQDIIRLLG
jgi:regulator of sigma E protease